MLNFSLYLTVERMDEAFNAIKFIERFFVHFLQLLRLQRKFCKKKCAMSLQLLKTFSAIKRLIVVSYSVRLQNNQRWMHSLIYLNAYDAYMKTDL